MKKKATFSNDNISNGDISNARVWWKTRDPHCCCFCSRTVHLVRLLLLLNHHWGTLRHPHVRTSCTTCIHRRSVEQQVEKEARLIIVVFAAAAAAVVTFQNQLVVIIPAHTIAADLPRPPFRLSTVWDNDGDERSTVHNNNNNCLCWWWG